MSSSRRRKRRLGSGNKLSRCPRASLGRPTPIPRWWRSSASGSSRGPGNTGKLAAENFLECYHCAVAHPGFSALVDVSPDAYELTLGDAFSSQFGPVRENGSGLDTEGEVARSQFHFLWPNTMVNIFPGRTNLSIGPVLPAGPERTERFLDYFFGPEVEQGGSASCSSSTARSEPRTRSWSRTSSAGSRRA